MPHPTRLSQSSEWEGADGTKTPVNKLTDDHLYNITNLLLIKANPDGHWWRTDWLFPIVLELEIRGIATATLRMRATTALRQAWGFNANFRSRVAGMAVRKPEVY